ncbi:MAG: zf-HC2 domain-containing protein [Elusimicrobia bacterium]|nr:zf-HC2 domain-containing protein [Candidatus Obscuribacterium magneticum]
MNVHEEMELLSAYLDEQLESAQRARIEIHVQSCPDCRAELNKLKSLKTFLQKLPNRSMPAALVTSLEARAAEQLNRKSWVDWLMLPRIWVPASAFALSVLALTMWPRPNAVEENSIPVESILAAHHRYVEENAVPSSDLSSDGFSTKLASFEGSAE